VHGAKALRVKEPLKNLRSPLTQRIAQVLFDPSAETSNETLNPATRTFDIPTLSLNMVVLTLCSFGPKPRQLQPNLNGPKIRSPPTNPSDDLHNSALGRYFSVR